MNNDINIYEADVVRIIKRESGGKQCLEVVIQRGNDYLEITAYGKVTEDLPVLFGEEV